MFSYLSNDPTILSFLSNDPTIHFCLTIIPYFPLKRFYHSFLSFQRSYHYFLSFQWSYQSFLSNDPTNPSFSNDPTILSRLSKDPIIFPFLPIQSYQSYISSRRIYHSWTFLPFFLTIFPLTEERSAQTNSESCNIRLARIVKNQFNSKQIIQIYFFSTHSYIFIYIHIFHNIFDIFFFKLIIR